MCAFGWVEAQLFGRELHLFFRHHRTPVRALAFGEVSTQLLAEASTHQFQHISQLRREEALVTSALLRASATSVIHKCSVAMEMSSCAEKALLVDEKY